MKIGRYKYFAIPRKHPNVEYQKNEFLIFKFLQLMKQFLISHATMWYKKFLINMKKLLSEIKKLIVWF